MTQRVYFNKGAQPLTVVPRKNGGPVRVASATYAIYDLGYGESSSDHVLVPAGTVAAVDNVSTVLTNKAGSNTADPRVITVVSTAGFQAFHTYILTSPDGRVEEVSIAAVTNGTQLLAGADIRGQFATGSTLQGIEVTGVFPESATDETTELDKVWKLVWTIPGFNPIDDQIHLVRGEEGQLASLDDLKELDQNIAKMGGNSIDPAACLTRAHKTFRAHLMIAGAKESDLLTGTLGRYAVTLLAAHYCYRTLDGDLYQKLSDQYLTEYGEIRAALSNGALKPEVINIEPVTETLDLRNPVRLFRANGFI